MTARVMSNPPAPGSPEWQRMITASKVPVILGLSPWSSPYALWHEMTGAIERPPLTGDHLDWGHDAEESLVLWWKRKNPGWQTNRGEIAYTDDGLIFPNMVTLDRRARRGRRFHIIECKTARDLDTWGRPGDPDSVRADYLAQVIFQMGVSGIHEATVIVLGPHGAPEIHPVEWDPDLWAVIVARCEEWHRSLIDGTPPPLDDSVATHDAVRGLHPDIDRDLDAHVDETLARDVLATAAALEEAEAAATGAKTRLLDAMGRARRAMYGDTRIATRAAGKWGPQLRLNRAAAIPE